MASIITITKPPVRPKDRFLVFGSPIIEDAEIQEVVASMKTHRLIFALGAVTASGTNGES
jgi:hypothetical protein